MLLPLSAFGRAGGPCLGMNQSKVQQKKGKGQTCSNRPNFSNPQHSRLRLELRLKHTGNKTLSHLLGPLWPCSFGAHSELERFRGSDVPLTQHAVVLLINAFSARQPNRVLTLAALLRIVTRCRVALYALLQSSVRLQHIGKHVMSVHAGQTVKVR